MTSRVGVMSHMLICFFPRRFGVPNSACPPWARGAYGDGTVTLVEKSMAIVERK